MFCLTRAHYSAMACSAVLALAGCGGGGDSTANANSLSAEGVYSGNLTGGGSGNFQMLILENNEVWAMYGTQATNQFLVAGFVQGAGSASNGSYSSANIRDFGVNPAASGTASAAYNNSTKKISGTLFIGGKSIAFSGGPVASSLYNYDTSASVSTVSGAWSLTSLAGESIALNIASNGTFSATSNSGCTFSGTLVPRPSGKNVLNMTMTFGAAPCALPGQSATGIALSYPLSTGQTQLILAGYNSDRTVGAAAFGTR